MEGVTLCDNNTDPKVVPMKPFLQSITHLMSRSRSRRSLWQMIMVYVEGFKRTETTMGWSFEDWKRCLEHGSDKIRFEYFVDNLGNPQYLRAIQRHSGGENLDGQLQSHIRIPIWKYKIAVFFWIFI